MLRTGIYSVERYLLLKAESEPLSASSVRLNAGPMALSNAPGVKAGFPSIRARVKIEKSPHPGLRMTDLIGGE